MTNQDVRPGVADPPRTITPVTIAPDRVPDLTSAEGLANALGLDRGAVAAVQVTSTASTGHSSLTFLDVVYANAAAAASLPTRLMLKHKPPAPPGAKPQPMQEVAFYARAAATLPSPPVVRCVAAQAPSASSAGYFLIEDLRATHAARPSDDDVEADFELAVDALARIHASRWEADDRVTWPGGNATESSLRAAVQRIGTRLPAFFDAAGGALPADGRHLYERVFSSTLRPWLRLADARALTLVHGSAHVGNVLFPREPGGDVYLVDWEGWGADVGARDLAYMMLRRSPDRRRQIEEPLLRRYHAQLQAQGVRGYGWDDLWTDYRRSWVRNLTVPIRKQHKSAERWQELLDHVTAAYVDLDGDELL